MLRPDSSSSELPEETFDFAEIRDAEEAAVSVDTVLLRGFALVDESSNLALSFFLPNIDPRRLRRREPEDDAVSVDPFLLSGADSVESFLLKEAASVDPFLLKGGVESLDPILLMGRLWWDVDRAADDKDRDGGALRMWRPLT